MAKKESKPRNVKKQNEKSQENVQIPESTSTQESVHIQVTDQTSEPIERPESASTQEPTQTEVSVLAQETVIEPVSKTRPLNKTQARRKAYWDNYNAKNGIMTE